MILSDFFLLALPVVLCFSEGKELDVCSRYRHTFHAQPRKDSGFLPIMYNTQTILYKEEKMPLQYFKQKFEVQVKYNEVCISEVSLFSLEFIGVKTTTVMVRNAQAHHQNERKCTPLHRYRRREKKEEEIKKRERKERKRCMILCVNMDHNSYQR